MRKPPKPQNPIELKAKRNKRYLNKAEKHSDNSADEVVIIVQVYSEPISHVGETLRGETDVCIYWVVLGSVAILH